MLILGAGASNAQCGMSMGGVLFEKILNLIGGNDRGISQAIQEVGYLANGVRRRYDTAQSFRVAKDLGRTMNTHPAATSIDDLLEHYPNLVDAGKAAIAYVLLQDEGSDKPLVGRKTDERWYSKLFQRMKADTFHKFIENPLTIVTYNYDRTFERFLIDATTAQYNRHNPPPNLAARLFDKIHVIHLHGQLGTLDDVKFEERQSDSADGFWDDLHLAATRIKIIHEISNVEDDTDFKQARTALRKAQNIVFLGFGFHPKNMTRLKLNDCSSAKVYSTGFGMGPVARGCAKIGGFGSPDSVWRRRSHHSHVSR